MKFLLSLAALLTLAKADVSHLGSHQGASGYHYQNPPLSSYGVPQASVLSLPGVSGPSVEFANAGFSTASPVAVTVHGYNGFSTPAPTFQVSTPAPSVDFSNFQVSTPAPSVVDFSNFQVSTPSPTPSVNLVQYSQPSSSYQFLSKLGQPASFGAPAASGYFGGPVFASGKTSGGSLNDAFGVVTDAALGAEPVDVSKNLYFFAAPEEEEEEIQAKVELPPVPPKKTYKIIFIKAPAYRNPASITIPAPPQNDEKTLVYVLVKKPDGQPKVKFQSAAPVQPSKPEVFFIKYKTQKEAEAAVAEIQNKHGAAGHVIANLPAGAQSAIQSEGGLSLLSTPSAAFNFDVSSTAAPLSFGGADFGSLNNIVQVSSTPAPLSFGSGGGGDVVGSLNNFASSVSSTPAPLSFGSSGNVVGPLNNFVSVSSTPAPLSFGNGIVTVSSTPSSLSFGPIDSLGANSFVSSTPAPVVVEDSFQFGQGGTSAAPVQVEEQQGAGGDEPVEKDGGDAAVAAAAAPVFTSYGPPKY